MANISVTNDDRNCKDFTTQTYGRLTTIGPPFMIHDGRQNRRYQKCECSCGKIKQYRVSSLQTGDTQSCGCLMREVTSRCNSKHRLCGTTEYKAWASMLGRCLCRTHKAFHHYGGRGITICDRWKDFSNFLADMGPKPTLKHSLDRIDNSGNYCPENCRWATWSEQANNKRSCRMVTIDGVTDTLKNWCRYYDIRYNSVQARLRLGWDIVTALTKPIKRASTT